MGKNSVKEPSTARIGQLLGERSANRVVPNSGISLDIEKPTPFSRRKSHDTDVGIILSTYKPSETPCIEEMD
jgi:hypothetical protein